MTTIEKLSKDLKSRKPSIIGIDGPLASGKTILAKQLALEFDFSCIHIDTFLDGKKGKYYSDIKFKELKKQIESSTRPLIIEGACLLKIFDTFKIVPDYLVYIISSVDSYKKKPDQLETEVEEYTQKYLPEKRADLNIRSLNMKTQHDVDIAYLKFRTIFSSLLALGGIISIIAGILLLHAGLQGSDSAIFKLLGAEISAQGIGGVILTTSAVWAYLAYRSRPVYRHKKETKKSIGSDGAVEEWETESSTRAGINPSGRS